MTAATQKTAKPYNGMNDADMQRRYELYLQKWEQRTDRRSAMASMLKGMDSPLQPATYEHFCTIWQQLEETY